MEDKEFGKHNMRGVTSIVFQHNFLQTNVMGVNKIVLLVTPLIFSPSLECLEMQNERRTIDNMASEMVTKKQCRNGVEHL